MRHGHKVNHLGRTSSHRKALMKNLANALILNKHIFTTQAKARSLRTYIEPLINRTKENTTHNRRMCFAYLQDKESIKTLFGEIAEKIGTRPGGYTRIIKIAPRRGDAADMALIELVDFSLSPGKSTSAKTTSAAEPKKRTRRAGGAAKKTAAPKADGAEEKTEE